jgi:hypothetical protein
MGKIRRQPGTDRHSPGHAKERGWVNTLGGLSLPPLDTFYEKEKIQEEKACCKV